MATEEQIKAKAYSIWEQEGHPEGKDLEHYYLAKKILEEQEANWIIELSPLTRAVELTEPPKRIPLPASPSKRSIRAQHKRK